MSTKQPPLRPTHQGPKPAEPDPELSIPEWMELLMSATTYQLDTVRQAWEHQRPDKLTRFEQVLWWAPEDLLENARDALERDKRWADLPPVKRAAMRHLEITERNARQRGEATGSFLVNVTLSDKGELDVKLQKVVLQAIWHWLRHSWTPRILAVVTLCGSFVINRIVSHWPALQQLLK